MLNLNSSHFPVLTTARLVLRQLNMNDAQRLHELRADPEVNRYIDRDPSTGIDAAIAHIQIIDKNIKANQSMYWVITLKPEDIVIGTICLWNFDHDQQTVELGYELLPQYQGKGLMAEAVTAVIDYGFGDLNAKVITAYPSADNLRSVALLQKFSFIIDEHLTNNIREEADNMVGYKLIR